MPFIYLFPFSCPSSVYSNGQLLFRHPFTTQGCTFSRLLFTGSFSLGCVLSFLLWKSLCSASAAGQGSFLGLLTSSRAYTLLCIVSIRVTQSQWKTWLWKKENLYRLQHFQKKKKIDT